MSVYPPAEDSFFLKNFLEKLELKDKKALDMGTGSGILALKMAEKGAKVTAADFNEEALKEANRNAREKGFENQIDFFQSNLFENINQKYDIVVFNPPYLPGEKFENLDGGRKGVELTVRFLENVREYLKENGEVYFIASDKSDLTQLEQFQLEKIDTKELWFEKLILYRF